MRHSFLKTVKGLTVSFFIILFSAFACAQNADDTSLTPEEEIAALKDEIKRITGMLPAQAVAMTVVEYNYSNLWFATHEENWPLAKFFLSETRARLNWALRISPQRRISTGSVELKPFLDTFLSGPYAELEQALASEDIAAFEAAYNNGLNACVACHEASEKGFLRVSIPAVPAGALIHFSVE